MNVRHPARSRDDFVNQSARLVKAARLSQGLGIGDEVGNLSAAAIGEGLKNLQRFLMPARGEQKSSQAELRQVVAVTDLGGSVSERER